MVELVVFDCDGVLVDSERLAVKVDVQVLAELGWTITEEECVQRFVGVSAADFRQATSRTWAEVSRKAGRTRSSRYIAECSPRSCNLWTVSSMCWTRSQCRAALRRAVRTRRCVLRSD